MYGMITLQYFRADKTHPCQLFALWVFSLCEVYAKQRPTLLYVRYLLFPQQLSPLVPERRLVDVSPSFGVGK